jgi:hypothetical protein
MVQKIYLEPDKVPLHLRGGYTGKKFAVEVTEIAFIPADAGTWSGGTRDTYRAIRLSDGAGVKLTDTVSAPWDDCRKDQRFVLTPGLAIVRHTMFCGKDMGLTFYLNPSDAAPMLPAPADGLSRVEQMVLDYTAGRKSSYNGKDRYEMARDDWRHGYMTDKPEVFPTREVWDAAKVSLASRLYLNKAGAITPAGRNMAGRV